jgi:hypothetical protein|uniref:Uncharacterized protein n=1 Tax=Phaeodactylum tricornutum TaxID=2850 RepID=A0A8J9TFS3_PHATR
MNQLLFVFAFLCLSTVSSFTIPVRHSDQRAVLVLAGTKEDEIAALEEKLRRLKEDEDQKMKEEDLNVFAADQRTLERVRGKDMLLSEQELIEAQIMEKQDGSDGNIVPKVAAALGLAVALLLFAQIPVGQEDYQKYSVSGSSTVRTIDLGDLNRDVSRP